MFHIWLTAYAIASPEYITGNGPFTGVKSIMPDKILIENLVSNKKK